MILRLNEHPQEAVAAIDSSGATLKYGELLAFSEEIKTLLPERSLLFLLTENNVGGIAWSIGCMNSGNVPLILNAHIETGLFQNGTTKRWRKGMAMPCCAPGWSLVPCMRTCPICCRLPARQAAPSWYATSTGTSRQRH